MHGGNGSSRILAACSFGSVVGLFLALMKTHRAVKSDRDTAYDDTKSNQLGNSIGYKNILNTLADFSIVIPVAHMWFKHVIRYPYHLQLFSYDLRLLTPL